MLDIPGVVIDYNHILLNQGDPRPTSAMACMVGRSEPLALSLLSVCTSGSERTARLFEQSLRQFSATKRTGVLFLGISLCLGVPREFSEGRQLANNGE